MLVIGVTGNIGSGKTAVSKILEGQGAYVINADIIAREVLGKNSAGYDEAVRFFGESVLQDNGEIDRRHLAQIVFSDSQKLEVLNSITHKYVIAEIDDLIANVREQRSHEVICLDVPLLFESGLDRICDVTWTIDAPYETKIARVMERDKADRQAAKKRLSSQTLSCELRKKSDMVIENDGNFDELERQVLEAFLKVLR